VGSVARCDLFLGARLLAILFMGFVVGGCSSDVPYNYCVQRTAGRVPAITVSAALAGRR
jgi:hypothetical protein